MRWAQIRGFQDRVPYWEINAFVNGNLAGKTHSSSTPIPGNRQALVNSPIFLIAGFFQTFALPPNLNPFRQTSCKFPPPRLSSICHGMATRITVFL